MNKDVALDFLLPICRWDKQEGKLYGRETEQLGVKLGEE